MPAWMDFSGERWPRLLLEAAALFAVATFLFDALHFTLHVCLNSRRPWLRRLAGPHEAHHDFCDGRLIYHYNVIVPHRPVDRCQKGSPERLNGRMCWRRAAGS
jgi:hypothetical protein